MAPVLNSELTTLIKSLCAVENMGCHPDPPFLTEARLPRHAEHWQLTIRSLVLQELPRGEPHRKGQPTASDWPPVEVGYRPVHWGQSEKTPRPQNSLVDQVRPVTTSLSFHSSSYFILLLSFSAGGVPKEKTQQDPYTQISISECFRRT